MERKVITNHLLALLFLFITLLPSTIQAQKKVVPYPRLSPLEKTEVQIGMVNFKLEYSRPSKRGREIFGALETYGEVWRTGANKNIKLSIDESIIINKKTLPAGTYTLFTQPDKDQWTVYFYDHIDQFGVPKQLDTFQVITEFIVKPSQLASTVETMDISFGNITYGSGDIEIRWDKTQIAIPFIIPYTSIIANRLADQRNIMASDYATTANIYRTKKKDTAKAMEYLNLCTDTRENGTSFDQWLFNIKKKDRGLPWAHLMKSEIYAERQDYKNAIKQARLSMQIAKVVGSKYYQRENTANLEKWGKE